LYYQNYHNNLLENLFTILERKGITFPNVPKELNLRYKEGIYKKGEYILPLNKVERNVCFLESGMVKVVSLSSENRLNIVDFWKEGDIFCGLTSFIIQEPSDVYIEAIQDCKIISVDLKALEEKFGGNVEYWQVRSGFMEKLVIQKIKKEKELITLSGKERYEYILKNNPEFVQNASVGDLAAYLGVHKESLSRIRKSV